MRVELKNIGNQGPEHFQQSGTADHLWQSRAYKEGFTPMRKKEKGISQSQLLARQHIGGQSHK